MEELSGRPKIAYLLLAAAGLDIAARCWHWHHVDGLRQQYLAIHGSIDIPEGMYFAGLFMNVQVPLLLLFLILQYASAVAFVCNCRGIGAWRISGFWCAWLTAWPVCIFAPLVLAS